jgi:hypothetical protein
LLPIALLKKANLWPDCHGRCLRLPVTISHGQHWGAKTNEERQASDLWLQNKAGVIMHRTGTQTGVTLSLGRDEIIFEMAK